MLVAAEGLGSAAAVMADTGWNKAVAAVEDIPTYLSLLMSHRLEGRDTGWGSPGSLWALSLWIAEPAVTLYPLE